MRHTLPQGVLGPFFNDDFGGTFGITYGFIADGFSQREPRALADHRRYRWDVVRRDLRRAVCAAAVLPPSDRTELLVEVTLPQNASIFASEEASRRLDTARSASTCR